MVSRRPSQFGFGTHTHVPTADGRILKGGTAYQSDLGMTGPRESVLGREIEACVGRFVDGLPRKCPVAQGGVGTQGCLVEIDPGTRGDPCLRKSRDTGRRVACIARH